MKQTPPDLPRTIEDNIRELDALFGTAGLVRSRRGTPAGITHRLRRLRATPQELSVRSAAPVKAANGVEWLPVPGWEKYAWLWAGFSTRRGGQSSAYALEDAPGELNLGFTAEDDRATVAANRRLLAEAVTGDPETPLQPVKQIHSALVVKTAGATTDGAACKGDGLVTDAPGVLLAIQTADCIPVLVADRKKRVVAAFHAGWRGTVKRIVERGVGRMRLEYGSRPEDLVAAIGPGIGPCCYAIGDEVRAEFESQFSYTDALLHEVDDSDEVRRKYPMLFLTQRAPGHSPIGPSLHLDLTEANRRQLLDAGVKARAIRRVGGCTQCQPELFFSHRGAQGRAGRMMSVIGIRPR